MDGMSQCGDVPRGGLRKVGLCPPMSTRWLGVEGPPKCEQWFSKNAPVVARYR